MMLKKIGKRELHKVSKGGRVASRNVPKTVLQ